jgi:PAS domain S-box-containing protein/putative nucleotidyltransferase with HDIG domain
MAVSNMKQELESTQLDVSSERFAQLEAENANLRQERDELKRAEKQLRILVDNARDVVFQLSPKGAIEYISPKVRELYGYDPEKIIGKLFESTTPLSELPKALKALNRILAGETVVNLEIGQINSSGNIVFVEINGAPIIKDDKVIAVQGVMRDITERKRSEEAVRNSAERLIKALVDTMQAMAMIVEMRDPYTAGHQRRVTQLACVIAEKMGFSPDQITGLRLAGLIHDIGKVRVPAEILTNPNVLSEAEMTIIKMHPSLGYDLLKTLALPWPVADIINQHHERLNGSGYPSGLIGDDILPEAKILAVADVVEAIASHRPYRPALGIDKALEEILKNRDILYDPEVVDFCVKIFRDKDFKFQ